MNAGDRNSVLALHILDAKMLPLQQEHTVPELRPAQVCRRPRLPQRRWSRDHRILIDMRPGKHAKRSAVPPPPRRQRAGAALKSDPAPAKRAMTAVLLRCGALVVDPTPARVTEYRLLGLTLSAGAPRVSPPIEAQQPF